MYTYYVSEFIFSHCFQTYITQTRFNLVYECYWSECYACHFSLSVNFNVELHMIFCIRTHKSKIIITKIGTTLTSIHLPVVQDG